MKTSQDVIRHLEKIIQEAESTEAMMDDLTAPHAYEDVARLSLQGAVALLKASCAFMQTHDEEALEDIDNAEDYIEGIYDIIEGDLE